jgi:cell division transport system ATP-binding protein
MLIELRNVSKTYPPKQSALSSIDLKVDSGEFVFLAGASGAGKSTLLKLLYMNEFVSSGQISFDRREQIKPDPKQIVNHRRKVGIVFQDYKLLRARSILDNVAFPLEVLGVEPKVRKKQAYSLLDALGLADRADALPFTLSGGEQQRVAVARALIHRPSLVLADEPTGNLDREMTRVIFSLLLEASRLGVTVVVATHNLAVVEEMNLRTVVLDKGKVLGDFSNPVPVN